MKPIRNLSLTLSGIVAVIFISGCATGPKRLEPINTPPPQGELLKGLDVIQQPELEPEWGDFVKAHYPRWRQHYWVDRGNWGNRGYVVGMPVTNTAPVEAQIMPLPVAPVEPVIVPVAPPTIVESTPPKIETEEKTTTYTVRKGDSLWRIAGRVYGNPFKWPRIYKANQGKIKNSNKIYAGQVLTIPQN
jgi:hypothetical protein